MTAILENLDIINGTTIVVATNNDQTELNNSSTTTPSSSLFPIDGEIFKNLKDNLTEIANNVIDAEQNLQNKTVDFFKNDLPDGMKNLTSGIGTMLGYDHHHDDDGQQQSMALAFYGIAVLALLIVLVIACWAIYHYKLKNHFGNNNPDNNNPQPQQQSNGNKNDQQKRSTNLSDNLSASGGGNSGNRKIVDDVEKAMTAMGAVPRVIDAANNGELQQQLKSTAMRNYSENADNVNDDGDEELNDVQKAKRKRQTNKDRTDPAENEEL
nr:uncharacterized protein LOC124489831 [Dermatophagoides farinae]